MTTSIAPVTVRDATRADVPLIAAWNIAMALETENYALDESTVVAGVGGIFDHPERGFYLVATVDGTPAGSLMTTREWSDWRNGEFWWVQSVYVAPEFRRRGVYRSLYSDLKQRGATQACGYRLYVERENDTAQETYRRMGMHETHYRLFEEATTT